MDILFKRIRGRDLANNSSKLRKKFKGNQRRQRLIRARLDELADAANLSDMRFLPQAYCHEFKGDKAGQFAVKLGEGFHLVFEVANEPIPHKQDGGVDWTRVTAIRILELAEDYHD